MQVIVYRFVHESDNVAPRRIFCERPTVDTLLRAVRPAQGGDVYTAHVRHPDGRLSGPLPPDRDVRHGVLVRRAPAGFAAAEHHTPAAVPRLRELRGW